MICPMLNVRVRLLFKLAEEQRKWKNTVFFWFETKHLSWHHQTLIVLLHANLENFTQNQKRFEQTTQTVDALNFQSNHNNNNNKHAQCTLLQRTINNMEQGKWEYVHTFEIFDAFMMTNLRGNHSIHNWQHQTFDQNSRAHFIKMSIMESNILCRSLCWMLDVPTNHPIRPSKTANAPTNMTK